MISDHKRRLSISFMCKALRVSTSGYYKWLKLTNKEPKELDLSIAIRHLFYLSKSTYGCDRMKIALQKHHGIDISRGKTYRLMKRLELHSVHRKKYKVCTTDSDHKMLISPNILNRSFNFSKPNHAWVSDITYIPTSEGWQYLAVVIDLFNREVIGWALSSSIDSQLIIDSLKNAINKQNMTRSDTAGVIFHSDRGSQYASNEFRRLLVEYDFKQSMSRKGNCWDNAVAESFFKSLKMEEVYQNKYEIKEQALEAIFEYIENFYNKVRIHTTLDGMSPKEFKSKNAA